MLEYVVHHRKFVRQADLSTQWTQELAYFILHREPWLLQQVREGWESNGKGFGAMDISDQGKADELKVRVAELKKDPFHPRRTRSFLLRGIMSSNTFRDHAKDLPIFSQTLNSQCEEPVEFYHRIYLGVVANIPDILRPGMPRSGKYISRLSQDKVRELLTDIGVKIVNGHVKSI